MPAQSLSDLAKQACSKNVKRIFDIGDCRYDLIRSTLLKIESPEQLVSRSETRVGSSTDRFILSVSSN